MKARYLVVAAVLVIIAAVGWLVACSGGNGSGTSSMATVNTSLSDPPTCASQNGGSFSHVYVSIADVQIHTNPDAQPGDSGWVDLTPNLKSAPQQVDLLALGGNGCILAQLGSNTQIQPGTYQQIRLYLAPNSASVSGNQCGSANNCVVYNSQTVALNLSSETQTGMKIPSGQIAGGNFTVGPGEVKGLNIDFDACASIVMQGMGQFRLKPVLHAGEVSTSNNSITGTIVKSDGSALVSPKAAIVSLETQVTQPDGTIIDRMVMQTTPDPSTGQFIFCPVPAGTYDVVAVVVDSTSVAYSATITSGVQPGNALGAVKMYAQPSPNTTQGSITGVVQTNGTSSTFAGDDVALSALEQVTIGSANVLVTIPLAQEQSTVSTVTTVSGGASCPAGTFCANFTLELPTALPYLGAFTATGASYAPITGTAGAYILDAQAYQPKSGSTPTCSPSELTTTPSAVTSGVSVQAQALAFTGCQ